MKYINHSVVGDQQYGGSEVCIDGKKYNRQMLHAYCVIFIHPKTSKIVEFVAELPNDMSVIFKK
jgi:23S rRNA pseudouridine1911/1915/1917 synthase